MQQAPSFQPSTSSLEEENQRQRAREAQLARLEKRTKGDREDYLVIGADIEDPIHCLIYRTELSNETYSKVFIDEEGDHCSTTCPVGLALGTKRYRIWQLKGQNMDLLAAYDPRSLHLSENPWWASMRQAQQASEKIPTMHGALVIYRWHRPLPLDTKIVRREIGNFLVCRYLYKCDYRFFLE